MQIVFSNNTIDVNGLYPFTLTRRIEDIRIGIFTIKEKWTKALKATIVSESNLNKSSHTLIVSANIIPGKKMIAMAKQLIPGEQLCDGKGNVLVHYISSKPQTSRQIIVDDFFRIEYPWHIFQYNAKAIQWDFELAKKGRKSVETFSTIKISNKKNVFIEKGAVVKHTIINADEGPVFIEKEALVMEGCLLRGPIYIGKGAVLKMGTKVYGATTIGPGCTVGGEIKNSVLFAFSNKAHDGYLGDSVIGEWCNLGGGTSNSNIKNTGGDITVHLQHASFSVGKKCGVLMGDYSRTAINTSINTGTVIGVSANIFGQGLTPKHIPSFSWGFNDSIKYKLDKALKDIQQWKSFKKAALTDSEKEIIAKIYKSKIKEK